MRRLLILAAALAAALWVLVPGALAADPVPHTGRVLVSTQGNVTIPAGEQADVVVVVSGGATVQGTVNTLVVIDGTATVQGARLETIVAVRSQVEVGDGTVVTGEIKRVDSTVHQSGNVDIRGGITDLATDLTWVGAALAPALLLVWLGFGLATVVAALLVAGLAPRQVYRAERLISEEPLPTFLTGLLSVLVIPIGAVVLFATLIGAPLAFGILFQLLPLIAFTGYLVAAIWTGDWVLRRGAASSPRAKPYLASVAGVLILGALGLVPILGIVVAIASLLGFGAVIRLAIQALRATPRAAMPVSRPMPAASGA